MKVTNGSLLLLLDLLLLLSAFHESISLSPPGKPVLLGCRSPEKETFTCWWKPGSDGGLQTTHRLYYEREHLEGIHECPDYQSGGKNSCYFGQNHTHIWVDYYLMVVASNALGNVSSEPMKMDVMDIVQPDAPENVVVQVEESKENPHLHIRWQHPSNTDTRSGWVTIKYQLRVKQKGSYKWNNYTSGTQTHFSLYSIEPGTVCMVQVRCSLDHGSWSEWSNVTHVAIPKYLKSDGPFWVLLSTLSVVSLFATMCIFVMKRKHVKQILLPPVPGPKIKGVNVQLLQGGQSDDIINSLIFTENFPPTVAWKDQMEDYLVVSDEDDWLWLDHSLSVENKKCLCLELTQTQKDLKEINKTIDVKDLFEGMLQSKQQYHIHPTKQQNACVKFPNIELLDQNKDGTKHTINPLTNSSGYVAVERHNKSQEDYSSVSADKVLVPKKESIPLGWDAQRRAENMPEGYSRVEEVESDTMILLHKQTDLCSKEKGDFVIECSNQKPGNPRVTRPRNTGLYTELVSNGYVDSLTTLPLT